MVTGTNIQQMLMTPSIGGARGLNIRLKLLLMRKIEDICLGWFTIELFVRFFVCPAKRRFCTQVNCATIGSLANILSAIKYN